MKKQWLLVIVGLFLLLLLAACGGGSSEEGAVDEEVAVDNEENADTPAAEDNGENGTDAEGMADEGADPLNDADVNSETGAVESVRVDLLNTQADLVGYADIIQEERGIQVQLDIADLEPGVHAIHFHIASSCTPPDGEGAGEPMLTPGTLPDITVEEDRTATAEFFVEDATLQPGDANSLMAEEGTSFVIHGPAAEEITTPETGDAEIIACGAITP